MATLYPKALVIVTGRDGKKSLMRLRNKQKSRRSRPLNALASLGAAGHNGFERWAGVGIFLEPWIGRRGSNMLWGVVHPLSLWRGVFGTEHDDASLAFNAGVSIAGAGVHFVEWPWSLKFGFLPWLEEAEGFKPNLLPAYNTILWLWMLGGVGSALLETRREHYKWVAAGVATAPVLLASARHHFAWAKEQAQAGDPAFSEALLKDSVRQPIGAKNEVS
jgi:hypothetical protein